MAGSGRQEHAAWAARRRAFSSFFSQSGDVMVYVVESTSRPWWRQSRVVGRQQITSFHRLHGDVGSSSWKVMEWGPTAILAIRWFRSLSRTSYHSQELEPPWIQQSFRLCKVKCNTNKTVRSRWPTWCGAIQAVIIYSSRTTFVR